MNPPSSPGGGKPGGLGGKLGKTLLYASLGGAVQWICEKAGHSPAPHDLPAIVSVIATAGETLLGVSKDLSIHVIGERIGHTLFHSDAEHPTPSGLNHDIERVLARSAARTIVELMAEWEKIDRELRTIDHSQFDLDDLREACNRLLHNEPNSTVPDCVREWLDKLDQADILEHTGMETAPWTRKTSLPSEKCRFVEFFDWRFPAAFEGNFAEELTSDAKAQAKFTLVLSKRILELLGSNAAGIADIQSQLAALSASLKEPNASWLKLAAERHAELRQDMKDGFGELKSIVTSLKSDLAASGLKPSDLSQEELERELARRTPNLTPDKLHRLIGYALFEADISRILKYAPDQLIGRENELKLLNDAWDRVIHQDKKKSLAEKLRPHILTYVALGGEGKTSLVAKWAAELAGQDWPGCDAAFAWSFYSQGTREQLAASSDLFLKEALIFFGDDADKEFAASPAGAHEKGQRLARIVGQRRSLLILDGLEPLQYAPSSPMPGQLKDQGITALLKGLAASSHGLCVVTTRYSLPDLKTYWQTTAPEMKLSRLSREAGVHLLKTLGVRKESGTVQEFETLVEDVKGHALTLTLLGGFLKRAFHGDIRQRDRVKFEKADAQMDGGHAFRTMAAYEQWLLRDGGDEGRREVAMLRLIGLFDRPADAGCLAALRNETVPGLTEPLAGLGDDDWEFCLSGLEAAKLLTVNRDAAGTLISLDAHPHLREYFAKQLREQKPDAWRAAHKRLYERFSATTKEGEQPTLEDLEPLYQAVAHGCLAGLQQEACDKVYYTRIQRGEEAYTTNKLGVVGSDLSAIACFFDQPWSRVTLKVAEAYQGWLLNEAAFRLRALGRLTEALEPMRAGVKMSVERNVWMNASIGYSNLSEMELTLGDVARAVKDAEQSVIYADRSGDAFERPTKRTTHADALHQAGRRKEALTRFREAEQIQAESQPDYPLLYSRSGFKYSDLLLADLERGAWQLLLILSLVTNRSSLAASCRSISNRAAQTLNWAERNSASLLDIAINHLTLGRAAFYAAIIGRDQQALDPNIEAVQQGRPSDIDWSTARRELDAAVNGLRRAGTQHYLPLGLLTRAWLRFLTGSRTGPESAQEDLDEAWEIAERGPMKLHLADIHLHRARLFFREKFYPWNKNPDGTSRGPADDLAAAETLIEKCGYHRRDEELADAKAAILGA